MSQYFTESDFIQRLEMFIKSNYESRTEFCQKLDLSVSTVNGYFSRGTRPGLNFFQKFLNVHHSKDLAWILNGKADSKGDPIIEENAVEYKIPAKHRMLQALDDIINEAIAERIS